MPTETISQVYRNVNEIAFEVSAICYNHYFVLNIRVLCFVSVSRIFILYVCFVNIPVYILSEIPLSDCQRYFILIVSFLLMLTLMLKTLYITI